MSNKFYCKNCGINASSVTALTGGNCSRHPDGNYKGRHELYEGGEKSEYTCRYCGTHASSISSLTAGNCGRHPAGNYKGRHGVGL